MVARIRGSREGGREEEEGLRYAHTQNPAAAEKKEEGSRYYY